MSTSRRNNEVCRTCLSTEGELISLFSETCYASRIPKKIMSISHASIDKDDGLPNKICRKCIYLLESFHCFKKQLVSADKRLRNIWDNSGEKHSEGVFPIEPAPSQSDNVEHDELEYDIEWISEEVRIEVEKAFRRKWAIERKKKLEETRTGLRNVEVDEKLRPNDIENKPIKTEKPEDCIEDDIVKSEELEESMEKEAIDGMNHLKDTIKKEFVETEELKDSVHSEKSNDGRNTEEAKEKQDSNIIVISDSSDEPDSPDHLREALAIIPTDSSGVIGNGKSSLNPQGGRRIVRGRVPASGKSVPGLGNKKESPSLKTLSAPKINSKMEPRRFFQCTRCNVNLFTVAAVLLHHNQVHTPNKASLCCRMCDKTFPAKSDLFAHFNQHVESHLFRCSYCPNEFVMKKNLMEHMSNHKKRPVLTEPKTTNKRPRISSENSVENSREPRQYANKNPSSAIAPKDSEDSGKENVNTADLQILVTRNLDKNPMDEKEEKEGTGKENSVATANSAVPAVRNDDENLMEQEEENCGNENRITNDAGTSVIQNPDNCIMDREQ